jgi:endogenous inhibitor of DNA gyrase (YacG/DUF329 family)
MTKINDDFTVTCNCPECGEYIEIEVSEDDVMDADTIEIECPKCCEVFEVELAEFRPSKPEAPEAVKGGAE